VKLKQKQLEAEMKTTLWEGRTNPVMVSKKRSQKPEGEKPMPERSSGPSLSMANHVLDTNFKPFKP